MIRQVHSQVSSELCRQQLLQVQGWDHFGLHLREGIEAGWRSRDKIGVRNEAGDKKLSEARRKKSFVLPLLGGSDGKESLCNVGDLGLIPGLGRIAWRRKWQPTPVFWPGESYGLRCLVGYSFSSIQFSSFQSLSRVRLLEPHELQHVRPPCPSPTPGVYPNSCPLSQWCHPTISSSVIPFSSCPQSFPASGSFQMSQLFTSGGQSIGVSASTSVLPMNTQDWFPLEWSGWISLQSKGLRGVFSKTTVQKHQFFGAQLSL